MTGIGKKIETRGHVTGFREEIAKARASSYDTFFTWFDFAESKEAAFVRGAWDFSIHVALPLAPYLEKTADKKVLDIGYGGGRMLAAAARHFGQAAGVDIHGESALVSEELAARGVRNCELFTTDGKTLPLPDGSIDVAYSFIVFMHLERVEVFNDYLVEIARVLKPGGLAVLYFGRRAKYSHNKSSALLYAIDRAMERVWMPRGYHEFPAKVNAENLHVALFYARKQAIAAGFRVLSGLRSHKGVPDGYGRYGRQHGLLLQKAPAEPSER